MTKYTNVRGLARGLQVLRALNSIESGRATSQQISDAIGLHRTTVRRLLETLVEEGFVRRSTSDDSFRLTLDVRSLSEGFTDDERIATIAPPIMGRLLQRVAWPSDLTTPDGDAMIIRETTHRFSQLSFHRSMVGRRLPILLTASGRAYFALCPDGEREDILDMLRSGAGGDEQKALASSDALVRNLVRRVRADGFGSNHGDWTAQNKIGRRCGSDRFARAGTREPERRFSVARSNACGSEAPLCARTKTGRGRDGDGTRSRGRCVPVREKNLVR